MSDFCPGSIGKEHEITQNQISCRYFLTVKINLCSIMGQFDLAAFLKDPRNKTRAIHPPTRVTANSVRHSQVETDAFEKWSVPGIVIVCFDFPNPRQGCFIRSFSRYMGNSSIDIIRRTTKKKKQYETSNRDYTTGHDYFKPALNTNYFSHNDPRSIKLPIYFLVSLAAWFLRVLVADNFFDLEMTLQK